MYFRLEKLLSRYLTAYQQGTTSERLRQTRLRTTPQEGMSIHFRLEKLLSRYLTAYQQGTTSERLRQTRLRTTPQEVNAWAGYKHKCECLTPRTLCAQQRKELLSVRWVQFGKCFSACQNGGPDACLSEENECLVYMVRSPVAGAPEEHNTQVQEAGGPAPRPAGAAAAPATPTPILPPPSRSPPKIAAARAARPSAVTRARARATAAAAAAARVRSSSFSELDTQGLKFCRSSR
ncbi:unnamed protein product [Plutella xylostella]|uniref:(diamondback moth) hypothetical protein n=1 Tax=Plutella xylostella TaxID=51655 RepID=A0A8S4EXN5_PLUXY|nr:unnamed protein product [Plutella xylostella]